MKKIIFVLIILVGLITNACCYEDNKTKIGQITDYNFENDIPELETIMEYAHYLQDNITYISDNDQFSKDYIQTPEEFYYNVDEDGQMRGDCDDIITFFCFLMDTRLNISSNYFVGVEYPDGDKHALAYINEQYYDIRESGWIIPLDELRDDIIILHMIPYYELIWMVVNYHDIVE